MLCYTNPIHIVYHIVGEVESFYLKIVKTFLKVVVMATKMLKFKTKTYENALNIVNFLLQDPFLANITGLEHLPK